MILEALMTTTMDMCFYNDNGDVKDEHISMMIVIMMILCLKVSSYEINDNMRMLSYFSIFLILFIDDDSISKSSKVYELMLYDTYELILCFPLMLFFIDILAL